MTNEQEKLCEETWKTETRTGNADYYFLAGWQACLDANPGIEIDWPEDKEIIGVYFRYTYLTEQECAKYIGLELIDYIPRPIEKWKPKEGEMVWYVWKDEKRLIEFWYTPEQTDCLIIAKLNPEKFIEELKMTEADIRSRGDFMEAGK